MRTREREDFPLAPCPSWPSNGDQRGLGHAWRHVDDQAFNLAHSNGGEMFSNRFKMPTGTER